MGTDELLSRGRQRERDKKRSEVPAACATRKYLPIAQGTFTWSHLTIGCTLGRLISPRDINIRSTIFRSSQPIYRDSIIACLLLLATRLVRAECSPFDRSRIDTFPTPSQPLAKSIDRLPEVPCYRVSRLWGFNAYPNCD